MLVLFLWAVSNDKNNNNNNNNNNNKTPSGMSVLPLDPTKPLVVAVVGTAASSDVYAAGGGSGAVSGKVVAPLQGIAEALAASGGSAVYVKGRAKETSAWGVPSLCPCTQPPGLLFHTCASGSLWSSSPSSSSPSSSKHAAPSL